MIKKTASGKYILKSKDGSKNLSKPTTKEGALKRERQVEYFKKMKATLKK